MTKKEEVVCEKLSNALVLFSMHDNAQQVDKALNLITGGDRFALSLRIHPVPNLKA